MKFTPALKQKYETLWNTMKVHRVSQAQKMAKLVLKGKARYEYVSRLTGVPWEFIGLTHYRESTCNFRGVLHNGQHIIGTNEKTTIVPKGRGPFQTWEEAALDALKLLKLDKVTDWSIGHMIFKLEGFNGYGYHGKGINSPYLWGGTNHYTKGKYVRDHVFDPNHVDKQLGVMAILKFLRETSASDAPGASSSEPYSPGKPAPRSHPSPEHNGTAPTRTQKGTAGLGLGAGLLALWYGYWWVLPLVLVGAATWYWLRSRRRKETPQPTQQPTVSTDQTLPIPPAELPPNTQTPDNQEKPQEDQNREGEQKPEEVL